MRKAVVSRAREHRFCRPPCRAGLGMGLPRALLAAPQGIPRATPANAMVTASRMKSSNTRLRRSSGSAHLSSAPRWSAAPLRRGHRHWSPKGPPWAPVNLGEEINGKHDETHPATRMAGFHLLFNSNRDGSPYGLYNAKSKRVVRRYDYSKGPSAAWFGTNWGWLIALVVSGALLVWLSLRAFRQPKPESLNKEDEPVEAEKATS